MSTLSIIIPAFNVENYILETLESINQQEVYPDEVIIIDDGSSDSTAELIDKFQAKFVLKMFKTSNNGQGVARNLGVKHAVSKYIYFFDSDDLLAHNAIKVIKSELEKSEVELLLFNGTAFSSDKEIQENIDANPGKYKSYTRGFYGEFNDRESFLLQSLQHGKLSCSPCLYVVKRDSLADSLEFNHWYHEDETYFYELIFKTHLFHVIDKALFHRRVRSTSTMTMVKSAKHFYGMDTLVKSLAEQLKKRHNNPIEERFILRSLEAFILAYLYIARKTKLTIDKTPIYCVFLASKSIVFRTKCVVRIFNYQIMHILPPYRSKD